jgi:hypothetical protein
MFQNPVEMWFTTTFLIIERLLKVKFALEQIIIDPEMEHLCQHTS